MNPQRLDRIRNSPRHNGQPSAAMAACLSDALYSANPDQPVLPASIRGHRHV